MRIAISLIIILTIAGCNPPDYPGYERLENSVHYKLEAIGDEDEPILLESYVSLDLAVFDNIDKPIAVKRFDRIQFSAVAFPEMLKAHLLKSNESDSIIFKGTVTDFKAKDWLQPLKFGGPTDIIRINMKVTEVLSADELVSIRAEERVQKDLEIQGAKWMRQALDSLGFLEEELYEDIYYRELEAGEGEQPSKGKFVTVQYVAKLPNGRLLDNTYMGSALEYEVGRPDQVLKGFALGVNRMKVGGKSLMVIPAHLAFGDQGSTEGIVPPFAPIIYEVELVDIGS